MIAKFSKFLFLIAIIPIVLKLSILGDAAASDDPNVEKERLIPDALSLSQALEIASANNEGIRDQKSAVQRAILDYEVTNEKYSSDFELSFHANRSNIDVESEIVDAIHQSTDNQAVQLSIIFPWWHKKPLRLEAAKKLLDVELQKTILRDIEQEVAMAIYRAYYNVVLQEEKLKIAKLNMEVAEARYASVSNQLAIGRSSQREAITQRSNLINHRVNVDTKTFELLNMRSVLQNLLGVEADFSRVVLQDRLKNAAVVSSGLDIEAAVAIQLLSIDLEVEKQRIDIQKAKHRWSPQLSAKASYTPELETIGSSNVSYQDHVVYGLVFKLPIPNFSASKSEIDLSNYDLNELLRKRTREIEATRKNAAHLNRQAEGMRHQIALLNELVVEKKKEVNSARESFSIGKTTSLELQMVEAITMEAESNLYTALHNQTLIQAEIYQLYGKSVLGQPIEGIRNGR